jgi:hypothetical protein
MNDWDQDGLEQWRKAVAADAARRLDEMEAHPISREELLQTLQEEKTPTDVRGASDSSDTSDETAEVTPPEADNVTGQTTPDRPNTPTEEP